MDPQLGTIAAEAREEIAFWPLATVGYLFVQSGQSWYLLIIFFIAVPSAISFVFLKKIRELVKESNKITKSRNRSNVLTDQMEEIFDMISESDKLLSGVLMFGINGIAGLILYGVLAHSLVATAEPNLIGVGLFILPVVTLAVAVSPVFW